MHQRQIIRDLVYDTLVSGLDFNVYKSKVYPVEEADLPCALLYSGKEQIAERGMGLEEVLEYDLVITVAAMATNNVDDVIDSTCKSIEDIIYSEHINLDIHLDSTEFDLTDNLEKPLALAEMVFKVRYNINRE